MKANVGDWLVIKGTTTERSDQRGLITEVHSADGSPPYVVRWLATGHVATVVPGPDAIVVTPEEQEAADERAQERAAHRSTNDWVLRLAVIAAGLLAAWLGHHVMGSRACGRTGLSWMPVGLT
jgi:hypothetical protein